MRTSFFLMLLVAGAGPLLAQGTVPSAPGTNSGTITGQIDGTVQGIIPGTNSPAATLGPAQQTTGGFRLIQPKTTPTLSPGTLALLDLEGRFQQAVVEGGGKAFASFFAQDAVILSNGQTAVQGGRAIAAQAQWEPKAYQLTWFAEGAQMGPSGDMGFTWGHYDGRMINPSGPPTVTSGRYFTVWKKEKDGIWKVAMEASAQEFAAAENRSIPHP